MDCPNDCWSVLLDYIDAASLTFAVYGIADLLSMSDISTKNIE